MRTKRTKYQAKSQDTENFARYLIAAALTGTAISFDDLVTLYDGQSQFSQIASSTFRSHYSTMRWAYKRKCFGWFSLLPEWLCLLWVDECKKRGLKPMEELKTFHIEISADIKAATLAETVKNANLLLGFNAPVFNFKLNVKDSEEE